MEPTSAHAATLILVAVATATVGLEVWAQPPPGEIPLQEVVPSAAVTFQYTHGQDGYRAARAILLRSHFPDHAWQQWDNDIGTYDYEPPRSELRAGRSLLKFTNLRIPESSKVVSARLTLSILRGLGEPKIAVYGMLKPFRAPLRRLHEGRAKIGDSTWNSQYHGIQSWGAPGASNAGSSWEYDGEADHYAEPDDLVSVTKTQRSESARYTFDVTRSLASQVAAGKLYGWLLAEAGGRLRTHVNLRLWGATLEVTYVPAGDVARLPQTTGKRLICFDFAKLRDVRQDLDRLKALPFHGATFWGIDDLARPDARGWLCSSVFSRYKLRAEDYADFIQAGRVVSSHPSPLTDNFLRVNACAPGTLEEAKAGYWTWPTGPDGPITMWWDDGFDTVVHNMGVAAKIAKEAGFKGIILDLEGYQGNILDFAKQRDAHKMGKTVEETRIQVQKRAERLMLAVNREYPDMTLIIIHLMYVKPSPDSLHNAFVDGLVAAANPGIRFVSGNERYFLTSRNDFYRAYEWDYEEAPTYSAVPEKYLRQIEVSFGVWLGRHGWGVEPELDESPASWQACLENALGAADRYVWVFYGGGSNTGQLNFWTGENLPQAYIDASYRALDLTSRRPTER
jgi:hypothetical protein